MKKTLLYFLNKLQLKKVLKILKLKQIFKRTKHKKEPEATVEASRNAFHLKTYPQTNSDKKRYYYRSHYLVTASEEKKEEITKLFNELMEMENLPFQDLKDIMRTEIRLRNY